MTVFDEDQLDCLRKLLEVFEQAAHDKPVAAGSYALSDSYSDVAEDAVKEIRKHIANLRRRIRVARRKLLQCGYDAPDAWLAVDLPKLLVEEEDPFLNVDVSPPTSELLKVIESIRAAVIRREALGPPETVARDRATEARDKWLYDQCCLFVTYTTIISRLKKKPKTWGRISTPQGIKNAANAFARRHSLRSIPMRARGRKPNR